MVTVYFPSSISGFVVYGADVDGNVGNSITTGWAQVGVQILITLHVLFSVLVVMNVFNQEVEELLGIPHRMLANIDIIDYWGMTTVV